MRRCREDVDKAFPGMGGERESEQNRENGEAGEGVRTVRGMCQSGGVRHANLYRHRKAQSKPAPAKNMDLRGVNPS